MNGIEILYYFMALFILCGIANEALNIAKAPKTAPLQPGGFLRGGYIHPKGRISIHLSESSCLSKEGDPLTISIIDWSIGFIQII